MTETLEPTAMSGGATTAPAAFTPEEDELFSKIKKENLHFHDYERQFQEVLMTLENDEVLETFRKEYEGLHQSFLKSHEGEGRLLRKCTDLQSDIQTCMSKALAAADLTASDKQTITSLTEALERTNAKATAVREREGQLRDTVERLRREMAQQQDQAREPVHVPAQEAALQHLLRVHEATQREEEQMAQTLRANLFEMATIQRRIDAARESNSANEAELRTVKNRVETKQNETQRILEIKNKKEEELRAVRDTVARRTAHHAEQQHHLDALRDDHERNGRELLQIKDEESKLSEAAQGLTRQLQHTNTAYQECNEDNDMWQKRVRDKASELQQQQQAVASSHQKYSKAEKVVEALRRRNVVVMQERQEAEEKRNETKAKVQQEENQLALKKRELQAEEQRLLAAKKEVDILHQKCATAEATTRRNEVWIAEKKSQLHHAESELASYEEHDQRTREQLFKVAQEAETHEAQAKKQAFTCANLMSEVRHKESEMVHCTEQLVEVEGRLKQQQSLLDGVVFDRNNYAKHHDQLRHELTELQHRFQLLLMEIKSMKSTINHREKEAAGEEEAIHQLHRQQKELETHLIAFQRRIAKKTRLVDQFGNEVQQLSAVMAEAEEEAARQRRRLRAVTHERFVLDGQVVKQSSELTALYEKLNTQQSILQHSEAACRDYSQQLEHLEYQTAHFGEQLETMKAFISRLPELRLLINTASRDLQRERARVAALMGEAERVVNVHPHQHLASSEPETYELVQKVQKLQRTLVLRRGELENKEEALRSVEQQYMKAKATVARQPGPEVAEQLTAYQQSLVKKQEQLRQMQETLVFFRDQTEQFRARHDVLRERLTEIGEEYAAQRAMAESERSRSHGTHVHLPSSGTVDGEEQPQAPRPEEVLVYRGFVAPPREEETPPTEE